MDFSKSGGTLRMRDKCESQKINFDTLRSVKLKELKNDVRKPSDETLEKWLADHVLKFFHQINIIYGTLGEYCTEKSCPSMTAGRKYQYLWQWKKEKPVVLPAVQYIDNLMTWIEDMMRNPKIFPKSLDDPYPSSFKDVYVTNIFRRLFRVYAHIYCHHQKDIEELNYRDQLDSSFKHFYLFVNEFKLIKSVELAPLNDVIKEINNSEE